MSVSQLQAIRAKKDGSSVGGFTEIDLPDSYDVQVSDGAATFEPAIASARGLSSQLNLANNIYWFMSDSPLSLPTTAKWIVITAKADGAAQVVYGRQTSGNLELLKTQAVSLVAGENKILLDTSSVDGSGPPVYVGVRQTATGPLGYVGSGGGTRSVWYASTSSGAIAYANNLILDYHLIRPTTDLEFFDRVSVVTGTSNPANFDLAGELARSNRVTLPPYPVSISSVVTVASGKSIIGSGNGSVIDMSGSSAGLFLSNPADITLANFTVKGGQTSVIDTSLGLSSDADIESLNIGSPSTFYGIRVQGTGVENVRLDNIRIQDVDSTAFEFLLSNSAIRRGISVSNLTAYNCGIGFEIPSGAEFSLFQNLAASNCLIGCANGAGNTGLNNVNFSENRIGMVVQSGGNDSHSSLINGIVNHCDLYGIYVANISLGFLFSNCQFWEAPLRFVGSAGVSIDHCEVVSEVETDDAAFVRISNSLFYPAYSSGTFTETGTSSNLVRYGNYWLDDGDQTGLND